MKKTVVILFMSFLLLVTSLAFAENLPIERDPIERYELQQVGTIMMHGGGNSGASYKIITDNGVAGLVNDGTEIQGWLTFLKPGNAIVDLYYPSNGKTMVNRYNYNIVPKDTFSQECVDVFNYVNHTRRDCNLPMLQFSAELNDICAVRAKELSSNYSHTRPDGSLFVTAVANKGNSLSENISVTTKPASETALPEYFSAWDSWNKNAESRANMLKPSVREMGMNYYYDPVKQKRFWVQIFRG